MFDTTWELSEAYPSFTIWYSQNRWVFKANTDSCDVVWLRVAADAPSNSFGTDRSQHWQPTPSWWFKLNSDAACTNDSTIELGLVIRDSHGEVFACGCCADSNVLARWLKLFALSMGVVTAGILASCFSAWRLTLFWWCKSGAKQRLVAMNSTW
ncbi:hypothetical protein Ancab_015732 [Ancistrocladus abbreviatus]